MVTKMYLLIIQSYLRIIVNVKPFVSQVRSNAKLDYSNKSASEDPRQR